jgi:hypothetical protein
MYNPFNHNGYENIMNNTYRARTERPSRMPVAYVPTAQNFSLPVPALPGSIVLIGKIFSPCNFADEVSSLFSSAHSSLPRPYDTDRLAGLPEPVQRYFLYALKKRRTRISTARVRYSGNYRTGESESWTVIEGEKYFNTHIPGFVWKGVTTLPTVSNAERVSNDCLTVTLLNLFDAANPVHSDCKKGELLLWLSEGVWFPTNLLPDNNLQWSAVDQNHARLSFHYRQVSLNLIVSFTESGEISEMVSEDEPESWSVQTRNYQEVNETMVPMEIEAAWKFKIGEFSHAKFELKKLDYDMPAAF